MSHMLHNQSGPVTTPGMTWLTHPGHLGMSIKTLLTQIIVLLAFRHIIKICHFQTLLLQQQVFNCNQCYFKQHTDVL